MRVNSALRRGNRLGKDHAPRMLRRMSRSDEMPVKGFCPSACVDHFDAGRFNQPVAARGRGQVVSLSRNDFERLTYTAENDESGSPHRHFSYSLVQMYPGFAGARASSPSDVATTKAARRRFASGSAQARGWHELSLVLLSRAR